MVIEKAHRNEHNQRQQKMTKIINKSEEEEKMKIESEAINEMKRCEGK